MEKHTIPISRVTRSKDDAKFSYNKMSRYYEILAGCSESKVIDVGLEKLAAKEGETILEIGFGTGYAIEALAKSVGETGKVYGIDIAEEMFKLALVRIQKAGLAERVELKCGDATHIPIENERLDAVFISFTLELFDNPEIPIVLQECLRILRNKGRICIVAMSKKGKPGFTTQLYEWIHMQFPKFVDCRPIYIQEALYEAGFQIVEILEKSIWGLPVEIVLATQVQILTPQ